MCLTHYLWEGLSDKIHNFLSDITLEELTNSENVRAVSERQKVRTEGDGDDDIIQVSGLS